MDREYEVVAVEVVYAPIDHTNNSHILSINKCPPKWEP